MFNPNAGAFFPTVFSNSVVITSQNKTTSRVMVGQTVEGAAPVNTGTAQQNTLPQLTATAYLNNVALNPQPSFKWYSSNPDVATVDQVGNVSRAVANNNASSFDSNGAVSTGQLGGLVQIRAVALRPDGSESGVEGTINIAVQAQGFKTAPVAYLVRNNFTQPGWLQDNTVPNGYPGNPTNNYVPNTQTPSYNLVS
jgi:Bacterial Ig-like domain (group 2)